MWFRALTFLIVLSTSACSNWIYRIDVPQGNYLEKKDIDKLQMAMSKEQVKFILGSPVIKDTFDNDTWYYVYQFKSGRNSKLTHKSKLVIIFENDRLISAEGDYKLPESFSTPIEH